MKFPASGDRDVAAIILSPMSSPARFRESRRGSRVPLKVVIAIEDGAQGRTCEGKAIVVNLHGALAATAIGLTTGMGISIHVYLMDKRAGAGVVYIGPKSPLHCGIELAELARSLGRDSVLGVRASSGGARNELCDGLDTDISFRRYTVRVPLHIPPPDPFWASVFCAI